MTRAESKTLSVEARLATTVDALREAAQQLHTSPEMKAAMLALATRLSGYEPVAASHRAGALDADLQAADACLSMLQELDTSLRSFEERKRAIDAAARQNAIRTFVRRRWKTRYAWMLLAVSLFLAYLIVGNLVLYYR